MTDDPRRIRLELELSEYGRFRAVARERGLSVDEAAREALVAWIRCQRRPDPSDPAFTVLDELDDCDDSNSTTGPRGTADLVET